MVKDPARNPLGCERRLAATWRDDRLSAACPSDEEPLTGGRAGGDVVRVGDTVRRPATANSAFVRRLLNHLEGRGFSGVPRALGRDEGHREVFSYLPGTVPSDLSHHDDTVIGDAARLIRRYHDLTAELLAAPAAREIGLEIVCHNDLTPCNFVFRAGRPVAIIDFDAAAPGRRVDDLGYAAWLWLDLGKAEYAAHEQRRRLGFFLAAYGEDAPSMAAVVDAILERQRELLPSAPEFAQALMRHWAERSLDWTPSNIPSGPEEGDERGDGSRKRG